MKKFTLIALALPLTTSCSLISSKPSVDYSAMHSPPSVTLTKGTRYDFDEGYIIGNGEKFISHYQYLRDTIGE